MISKGKNDSMKTQCRRSAKQSRLQLASTCHLIAVAHGFAVLAISSLAATVNLLPTLWFYVLHE